MDLDCAFVAAVLREGRESARRAIEKGVNIECLAGQGLAAWKFVLEYLAQYHEVPDPAAVEGKTGVLLDAPPPGPADFFADEILNRRLHGEIGKRLIAIDAHFQARDPQAAYAEYEEGLRMLRKLGIGAAKTIRLPSLGPEFLVYYDKLKAGERGILTPWPTINEATLGFWPEDFVLYVARLGVGKCLSAESEIVDPVTGTVRTIEEVYNASDRNHVVTWDRERVRPASITVKVDTGHKECFRFALGTGRSVEVTPEHPFLTAEGWRRADELQPGVSVAIPARMPFPTEPIVAPLEEVTALALLLAEESYSGNRTGFRSEDPRVLELAQGVAAQYGVDLRHRGGVDYDFVRRESSGPNHILELLRQHGMEGKKAVEKTIPDQVFRYGPDALAWFLTVFWMCDGCITDSGAEIVLGSERMLRQIQSLLLRFGVQSKVSPEPMQCDGGVRDAWRLRVLASGHETLLAVLGLWGSKRDNLEALVQRERHPNVGFPRVSEAFVDEIKVLVWSQAGRWSEGKLREVGERLDRSSPFMTRGLFDVNNTLLLGRFKVLCEVCGVEDKYRWLWASDLFWDTVEEISPVGVQKVYDLTVAPSSCFVANDILVHNTWALTIIADYVWTTQKKRVLFATTEMAQIKILQRWIAVHFKYPYGDLRKGRLSAFAEQLMRDKLEEMRHEEGLYIIGGEFDFRIETLEAAIEECEPDVVFIDGAYLLQVAGAGRFEKAANSFDELKRVAKRNHVPLVASTQFNREVKDKLGSAGPDKIALSDAAGWNADLIFGLVRTEDMKRDKRMIQLPLKFREGESDEIETWWDFDLMRFDELPRGAQAAAAGLGGVLGGAGGSGGVGSQGGASGASAPDPDPYGTGFLFGSDSDKDVVPF